MVLEELVTTRQNIFPTIIASHHTVTNQLSECLLEAFDIARNDNILWQKVVHTDHAQR
jgi:hypothetical protein